MAPGSVLIISLVAVFASGVWWSALVFFAGSIIPGIAFLWCPALMIHGLKDSALLSPGLNGNWESVEKDFTLFTIPDAGHFARQSAPDLMTRSIRSWLAR